MVTLSSLKDDSEEILAKHHSVPDDQVTLAKNVEIELSVKKLSTGFLVNTML
jgi:hypothetical protein